MEYVKNFFSRNEPRSTGATDKIQQYLESRVVFHRIHLAKALENYTKILGAQEVLSVFPSVLDKLSKDEKQVKQQLLLQIPKVVAFLLEAEKNGGALDFVTKWCVPVFARILLENPETEVYDAALLSISEFISVLPQSLLQNELFPLILSFKTDNQETFINILRLLQQILPKVDYKMAKPQIFKLIDSGITSNDSVKKHIIPLLSIISTMIQPDEAQIIKQHLEKLVLDENPEIRAESTSIFPKLSLQLNNDQQLVVLFEKLLNDNLSCSVRSRAATRLGEFICSFKAPIPDSLLGYYHSLITPNTEYTEGENQERLEICAFNFPGVLSATGREGWESLQKTFSLLISHEQEKVKSPIAFSLNEMMPILGPLLTEQFLVPVCETFLTDPKTTDFIKIGIMKNFSKLLEQLSQENRNKFLSYISNIPNEKNWRIKKFILKQLSQIVQLFLNSETLEKVFFPLVFKLQIDKVAAVRNVASLQFSKIVKTLKETELCNMTSFFNQFLELSNCAVYQNRQIFVKICEEILEYDKDLFAATFLPALLELSKDKVDSIRLSLATFFVKTNQSDNFKSNSTISEALDILKNDTNQEVVVLVETILQHQN
uniref:TOG domain-containing protein n=1 Tax=Arcella intermedia TaxID=1963864 RepID=A0A6B2KZT7_9EUKA